MAVARNASHERYPFRRQNLIHKNVMTKTKRKSDGFTSYIKL